VIKSVPHLKGSVPPVVTPLKAGAVDYERYARLIEFQIANGSSGVLVNGTSAEPSTLSVPERNRLVDTAIEAAHRRVPVFGLPGNPVSALVSFELFARPGLRRLAGDRRINRPVVAGRAGHHFLRRSDGKLHFRQVTARRDAQGVVWAASVEGTHSHRLSAMTKANALAILRDGDGVREGDPVDLLLLDPEGVAGDLDESWALGWDTSHESARVR